MIIVGIVCEYNPFHNGHLHQIETLRSRFGPDCAVVAIMSGNFVQRGEAAVLDKWSRTRAALLCGVNLVIELPVAYATGSAERFADGGVALAAACGLCDYLAFGSESGDLSALESIADILAFEPAAYQERLRASLDLGLSYAVSRVLAIREHDPSVEADILSGSNNILAVEYLKAFRRRNITGMKPFTIRREGQGYKEVSPLPGQSFWSASAIRSYAGHLANQVRSLPAGPPLSGMPFFPTGSLLQTLSDAMPVASLAIFADHFHRKSCIVTQEVFADAIFTRLSSLTVEDMARIPGMQEGLGARLKELVRKNPVDRSAPMEAGSPVQEVNPADRSTPMEAESSVQGDRLPLSVLIDCAATKRYPKTRVQRALLHMLLGLGTEDFEQFDKENGPFYLRILGFDKKGRYLLKRMKTTATLPILMKGSDFLEFANLPENRALNRMAELDRIATDLWMFKVNGSSGQDFTTPPIAFLQSPRQSAH